MQPNTLSQLAIGVTAAIVAASCGDNGNSVAADAQATSDATSVVSDASVTDAGTSAGPGQLLWAKRFGGASTTELTALATFTNGDSVVVGRFSGTTAFGSGEAQQTSLTTTSSSDTFVTRYAANGSVQWAKRAGGAAFPAATLARSVTTMADGTTVVVGWFDETTTFGIGEPNETELVKAGPVSAFVAKFAQDGLLLWATQTSGTDEVVAESITGLTSGATLVVGTLRGTATFGSGETNESIINATYGSFIARYNPDGSLAWAKKLASYANVRGVSSLDDGSTVIVGGFTGPSNFGMGETNATLLTAVGTEDSFVAKYAPNGTLVWAKAIGGSAFSVMMSVSLLQDGTAITAGFFSESSIFGRGEPGETTLTSAGEMDIFLARYRENGTLDWVVQAGGADFAQSFSVATMPDSTAVITGRFLATATFGSGDSATTLTAQGDEDMFIARYTAQGSLVSVKQAGTTGRAVGAAVSLLPDGTAIVGGMITESATFGSGEPEETTLISIGTLNGFIAKFGL